MKVLVTVSIHEGDGDLKSAEFTSRFRGAPEQIAIAAGQFTTRSIERAGAAHAEDYGRKVHRITEEEEEVQ